MRSLIIILIFLAITLGMFFLLSCIPLLWGLHYRNIINDNQWMLLGLLACVGISLFCCMEIWEDYFD